MKRESTRSCRQSGVRSAASRTQMVSAPLSAGCAGSGRPTCGTQEPPVPLRLGGGQRGPGVLSERWGIGRGGGLDPPCSPSPSGQECGSKVDLAAFGELDTKCTPSPFLGRKLQGRQGEGKGMPGECKGSDGDGGSFGGGRGQGWRAGAHMEVGHVGPTRDMRLRELPGCCRSPPTQMPLLLSQGDKPHTHTHTSFKIWCSFLH